MSIVRTSASAAIAIPSGNTYSASSGNRGQTVNSTSSSPYASNSVFFNLVMGTVSTNVTVTVSSEGLNDVSSSSSSGTSMPFGFDNVAYALVSLYVPPIVFRTRN